MYLVHFFFLVIPRGFERICPCSESWVGASYGSDPFIRFDHEGRLPSTTVRLTVIIISKGTDGADSGDEATVNEQREVGEASE